MKYFDHNQNNTTYRFHIEPSNNDVDDRPGFILTLGPARADINSGGFYSEDDATAWGQHYARQIVAHFNT